MTPKLYVFDIDGTICTQRHGVGEGDYSTAEPVPAMVARIRQLHAEGHRIELLTARGTETGIDWRAITEQQLEAWGVPYDALHFGKRPGDYFIDDRAVQARDWLPAPHVTVVAEIGINHNGSLQTALDLIDVAADAGCDAVKFQKRTPELCVPRDQWDVRRSTPWGEMSYIDYKRRMEFGIPEFNIIDQECRDRGIEWSASAWDLPSVEFIERYNIPWHKVASACLTDDALLQGMAETGKPIVLSTGMSTMAQIRHAVSLLPRDRLTILHCTSSYPCPPAEVNLRMIRSLQAEYPGVPIGLSDHSVGLQTTIAGVALGASFVERHITLDRSMWGTDQAASVEPTGLRRLVRDIRVLEQALGDGQKQVYETELPIMAKLRSMA